LRKKILNYKRASHLKHLKPRKLLPKTIKAMQPGLAVSPKLNVQIFMPISDHESRQLGEQIKAVLEQAGWTVVNFNLAITKPSIKPGINLYFWQRPTRAMQAVFFPIFDQFGYERMAYRSTILPKNTLRIDIGSSIERASNKSLQQTP